MVVIRSWVNFANEVASHAVGRKPSIENRAIRCLALADFALGSCVKGLIANRGLFQIGAYCLGLGKSSRFVERLIRAANRRNRSVMSPFIS
jgi:hypothetical protein